MTFKTYSFRLAFISMITGLLCANVSHATVIEFNTTGGSTPTNGLHFYIEDTTHIQVKGRNNAGQVYNPSSVPPSTSLDNGVFLRANGKIYGPDHSVTTFTPTGGMYNTYAITATSPANPSTSGVQQIATGTFGINSGPQVTIVWKYTTPLDFLTAEVTLVIPNTYAVSATNPVRFYHAFDNYLGGSDSGCGVKYTDTNGKLVVGSYPPASGSTCSNSTSIPTGVSVVESFRERSGLNFSSYCASYWQDFWVNGATNCSVLQTTDMSNTIGTKYQDTGIGVAFNFIAPGTYTFSYDFVVGSPNVPPYDHLEIRHPGTASLCAADITVLACTSSTIPCPTASIVNTGTLTGNVTETPTTPAVTETPSTFTLGSSASTANVSLLGTSPGGTYVLSSANLSTTPLNGTKCWNTTTLTASCAFVIQDTPCVKGFDCLETGVTYNNLTSTPSAKNPLYTKLAGTGFKFDVVALQANGVQATTYTAASNVTVELFDDSASSQPTCSAYSSPVASQAISFALADAGRKTLTSNISVANAYKKLRCRVRDNNLTPIVYGCSSDDFSVRPQNFTLTQTGLGSSPMTAGTNFSLTASAGVIGYNGAPTLLPSKTYAADTVAGTQYSLGNGMLTLADSSNSSITDSANNVFPTAAGTPATASLSLRYHDVGYLSFNAGITSPSAVDGAVTDDSFTAVDQTTDCISGSGSNTSVSGKYGCEIWNSALSDIGRFKPDHFRLTSSMTSACNAGTSSTTTDDFTYMSDAHLSISAAVNAESAQNITSTRYGNSCPSSGSCKLIMTAKNSTAQIDTSRLQPSSSLASGTTVVGTGASSTYQSTSWINGSYAINGSTYQYNRGTVADGPYDNFNLNFSVTDPDSVAFSGSTSTSETKIRYGRLFMQNVYGSELLALAVPLEAQYWNGLSYIRNQQDNCTTVPAASISLSNYRNNLAAGETLINYASGVGLMSNGTEKFLRLSKPGAGNNGSVDLTLSLSSIPWFGTNPISRATFGIYKTPVIYMRENF